MGMNKMTEGQVRRYLRYRALGKGQFTVQRAGGPAGLRFRENAGGRGSDFFIFFRSRPPARCIVSWL